MTEDADSARPKPRRDATQFPPPPAVDAAPQPKPTKAERLEARAARLRAEAAQRPAQGGTPTPTSWVVTTAVLAAVCAGLIALSVLLFLSRQHQKDVTGRLQATNAERADVVEVAKTFALDFGAYDYRHLDQDFAEVATRMTPSFAKSYTSTSGQLKSTFEQYKTQVTARLQGYGLTSATKTTATVIVFLDQTVKTTQSSTPRIDRNRLEIHLVQVKGKWLVAKLLAK